MIGGDSYGNTSCGSVSGLGPCEYEPPMVKQIKPYLMSKDELFELHRNTCDGCLAVMKRKNHDYTSGGSVFSNFKDSAILGVPPVKGILLRGKLMVEGEGVLDAIDDVINYMILAKGLLIEESRNGTE
jgi:hypothetical protein